jgi:hypothetical protein
MPSDPAGAKPSGVLTRLAPDFFDDHLGCGGFRQPNGPATGFVNYTAVSLFNNANSGVVFKVYGVECCGDVTSSSEVYMISGTLGTLVQGCAPTRPDLGAPYGQIYQATTVEPDTIHPNPYVFPPLLAVLGSGYPGQTHWWGFPRFIVPVGYSLVVVNSQSDDAIGASFVFQQANE